MFIDSFCRVGFVRIFTLFLIAALSGVMPDLRADESAADKAVAETTEVEANTFASRRFKPATFRGGLDAIAARMEALGRTDPEDRLIICGAMVTTRGRIDDWLCNWNRDNQRYQRPLSNAIRIARFDPARVDDVAVVAYVKFAMRVEQTDRDPVFTFYANHLGNEQFYGQDYIAAQAYVPGNFLYRNVPFFGKPWLEKQLPTACLRDAFMWLGMRIDANGAVHDIQELEASRSRPRRCVDHIKQAVAQGQYIPAFHNDQPVESLYIENYSTSGFILDERRRRR